MTVLTPSYHAETYGTDDNRYDMRQFLYDYKWEMQFEEIDRIVEEYERKNINPQEGVKPEKLTPESNLENERKIKEQIKKPEPNPKPKL